MGHSEALGDPGRGVDEYLCHTTGRHHQADPLGDKLEGVAVGRDNARSDALLVRDARQGADHIVRLARDHTQVAIAKGLDEFRKERALLLE